MSKRQVLVLVLVGVLVLLLAALAGLFWYGKKAGVGTEELLPRISLLSHKQVNEGMEAAGEIMVENEMPELKLEIDQVEIKKDLEKIKKIIPEFTDYLEKQELTFKIRVKPLPEEKLSLWYMWLEGKPVVGFVNKQEENVNVVEVYLAESGDKRLLANRVYWAVLRSIDKQWGGDKYWEEVDKVFRQRVAEVSVPIVGL